MKKQKRLEILKKIVADSYEITAEHFHNTRSKVAAADFQWAAKQINIDDKVFDAGCGNGRLLDYVKINPNNYLGFDQSNKLLAFARSKYPEYRFESGDLSQLKNLAEKDFSVVFCSAVLSHLPDKKERLNLLRFFYNISLDKGRLIVSFWQMKGIYRRLIFINRLKKLIGLYPYGWRDLVFPWKDQKGINMSLRYYYLYSPYQFKKDLITTGWKIEEINNNSFNYWVIARK